VLLNDADCLSEHTVSFCKRKSPLAIATARLNQLATVLEMVRMGHGVSLIPAMAVTHNDRGRVYRSLEGKKPTRTIAVGWSAFHFRTKLFDRFVEWVKGSAAGKNGK